MSLGPALDVTLGLVFTYLLLGLLVSGVQEVLAGWLETRGKHLRDGIAHLLLGVDGTGNPYTALFDKVFGHALLRGPKPTALPSYVPARNFELALLDALADGSQAPLFSQVERGVAALPTGPAKQTLSTFLVHAAGDLDLLKQQIATWFDDSMDRVSGVYKRTAQYRAIVLGLVIAVTFNVDSITIARTLWTDPAHRAAMVALASHYAETPQKDPQAPPDLRAIQSQIDALPVPIGWSDVLKGEKVTGAGQAVWQHLAGQGLGGIWIIVGWLLTGIAASMGAPFWFGVLQRVFNLRAAGNKPARAAPTT